MEVPWDTAFGGCIHAVQIGVTTMQPYLCGCLMQATGQPCIDPSWPVPDNLVPLSSSVNIHGACYGLNYTLACTVH